MSGQVYIEPVVKSQPIRLLDIAVVGPLMIAGGVALRKRIPWVAWPLLAFGVTTIGYNAMNYVRVRDKEMQS